MLVAGPEDVEVSPTDTQPVFDAIAERALRLTEASVSAVTIFDGELIRIVSIADPESPIARAFPMRPRGGSGSASHGGGEPAAL